MGIIKKQVKVAGSKSERDCEVLFDSGASACFVREDIASVLGGIVTLPSPISFRLGNNTVMKADRTSVFLLDLNGHKLSFYFLVVAELPYEVIVGANFFQNWKIKLDPITEDFIIDEKALEIMLVVLSKEVKPGEVESRREKEYSVVSKKVQEDRKIPEG